MFPLSRRLRSAFAAAAVATAALGAASTASAAPADTTSYTSAQYLEHTLGLPDKPKHVIESVTYDRLQWLLKQEGQFAFLIGDPATDTTFPARAQEVEELSEAAGVKRVYWFNPNLSGNAQIGGTTTPNLDIRNPDGITSIGTTNRTIYGHAWRNLIARHLGNGVAFTQVNAANTGSAKVTTEIGTTAANAVSNDYGSTPGFSTKIGDVNGGALFDYTGGTTPANVQDSYFFLYNKDATITAADTTLKPSKILAWVNLTDQPTSASSRADITAAIAKCGASSIVDLDEYAWWKSATNTWQTTSSPGVHQGGEVPVITDADGAAANGGWRVHQVTYPELVYLLKTEKDKDVVVLFGGTWCPNTRPVLPFINRDAQRRDVTVFNFDTILDGSVIGGGNSASNPLQTRGPAQSGATLNPSFVYGDLVKEFISNLKTQYGPDNANRITYYPGGDTTATQLTQPRLQVPYLFGYDGDGVNRQWIHDKGDGTYTEYMSSWHWTNPKVDQLNVAPTNALRQTQAWATLNEQLATFTWQSDPEPLKANTGIVTDAATFLTATDKATVTRNGSNFSVASSTAPAAIDVNPTVLAAALSALGGSAPTNRAGAAADLVAALDAPSPDATLVANLRTIVGAWGLSETRKNSVNSIWGTAGSPGSVAGGLAAVRAAEVFFDGLPSKVVVDPEPTPTPTPEPTPNTPEPTPTPSTPDPTPISGSGTQPGPAATPGAQTPQPGPATITRVRARKVAGAVAKAPTSKASGRYAVKITQAVGKSAATGTVTLKLTKGKASRTLTAKLRGGVATFTVPKLAKGTWKVAISWKGDTTYLSEKRTGTIKVKK